MIYQCQNPKCKRYFTTDNVFNAAYCCRRCAIETEPELAITDIQCQQLLKEEYDKQVSKDEY